MVLIKGESGCRPLSPITVHEGRNMKLGAGPDKSRTITMQPGVSMKDRDRRGFRERNRPPGRRRAGGTPGHEFGQRTKEWWQGLRCSGDGYGVQSGGRDVHT